MEGRREGGGERKGGREREREGEREREREREREGEKGLVNEADPCGERENLAVHVCGGCMRGRTS